MSHRALALGLAVLCGTAIPAAAHQLNVFASVDCEAVLVEAKFSNGRRPVQGTVQVLDGDNAVLTTTELTEDGTRAIPLETLDLSSGLVIEVDTGDHDDYWILTPEDIARRCGS